MNTDAEFPAPELIVRADETVHPGEVEIVERKGLGHPDTICDALAEELCRALCRAYLDAFGQILHHNVDKILLCGGAARPSFGGGGFPADRAVPGRSRHGRIRGAKSACSRHRDRGQPALVARASPRARSRSRGQNHSEIPAGFGRFAALFSRGKAAALSNDTSCGAGFAPLTPLERAVLQVEKTLNSAEVKGSHPAIGTDIKVMGVRRGSRIRLTISCAIIGRHLANVADYVRAKDAIRELSQSAARQVTGAEAEVAVNAADDIVKGEVFLTVTGTSAESGDDGETGCRPTCSQDEPACTRSLLNNTMVRSITPAAQNRRSAFTATYRAATVMKRLPQVFFNKL